MICVDAPRVQTMESIDTLDIAVIRDTISNSGNSEYSAAAEEGGEISGERALTLTLDPGHSALNTQGEVWAEGAGPILVNRLDTGPCTRRETQLI